MLIAKKRFIALIGIICFSFQTFAGFLQDAELNFGKIAISNNSIVSSVQISRTGRTAATGNLYIIKIGNPGVYTLTEFPPFSVVNLSANVPTFSTSTIPGTQQFRLDSVDMIDTLNIDADGTAQFKIGAVLQTSGVGGTYIGPATYQINLNIDITY